MACTKTVDIDNDEISKCVGNFEKVLLDLIKKNVSASRYIPHIAG